ncbi:MAG: type I glutamate--ammonia ligase [Oscillospiraceae bacterium]|nr:type I glutamate--ammonia ligase [Oscillospiraceae bacterium]
MNKFSEEKIIELIKTNNINFIRLQFVDIFGIQKNVLISSNQIKKALSGQIMIDGSSIEGFVRVNESDQYLKPDINTFMILPWESENGKVARFICDVYNPDGSNFIGDPRSVLKKALKKASDKGYIFNVGPECEFFLFQLDKENRPSTKTNDEASYFDLGPLDRGENVRQKICLALEELGFEIEAAHHEVAAGQHEIDFKYTDALRAADNIMTFKLAVKTIAQKNNLHATFMPKPIFGVCGSGMHINMSIFKNNQNIFFDINNKKKLSKTAYNFIAGLINHIDAITAITNPLVNSYKRLVPGYEAPCFSAWSTGNRSALIRVPTARGQSTRLELRSPDPSCNPYLAFAVCLEAGLDGIDKNLEPPKEIIKNIYDMNETDLIKHNIKKLPDSLISAIEFLKQDKVIINALGPHVFSQYVVGKQREYKEYITRISNWEINKYITLY